ncbi:MAG: DUF4838 domain-containing protein [Verrucomicrobiia bacterium]
MQTSLLILALTTLTATAMGAESITPGAMMSWKIVCATAATPSEKYAATEFQRLFKEMGGKELPLVEAADASDGAIFIGPDAVLGSGQPTDRRALDEEALRIRVTPNAVCIDGGRPRGTLYGVYEFYEELCGVRFLTFDHTYFPPDAAQRTIPAGVLVVNPTFVFRWSYYGETSRYPDFAARLRVNTVSDDPKLGGRTGYRLVNHNVAYLVPPAKWGKEHPEYFALVNGQRKLEEGGGGPQLCISNPELVGVVVEAVLEEIKKNPTARNINIAQMDNDSYCTCPNCAAIDALEESHAGATLAFVNAVAERVEKSHPEVFLSTFAYQYTRRPPKNIKPRPNVMIQLCSIECCDFHAIDDPSCPLNRAFCADLAGWKKIVNHVFIWHYNTNFKGYVLPFPNLRSIGPSVAYFANNNGKGVFMQAAGNGFSTELSDLRNYVMARCLWKPGRDSWKEAEEFCRLHYAESAGPILAYLKWYHDLVDSFGVHPTCFPTESSLCISPESARRIMGYFRDALALAKSGAVKTRVEKASLCAYRAAVSASSMKLTYRDGKCYPDLSEYSSDLLDQYAALCQRFGATMDDEMLPTARYLDLMRSLHAGLKAVELENEFWRLMVVPESNGKVVEMTYKPTRRNIARAPRGFNRFRHEEWIKQGDGPRSDNILAFDAQTEPQRVRLALTTKDGARLERSIALVGDAVRFETRLTAEAPRPFEVLVHPEYDTASMSADSDILGIYVKKPDWMQANGKETAALHEDQQRSMVKDAVGGGAYAYFNHQAKFGVEQRFDSSQFSALGLFWDPSRQQINLEMTSKVLSLTRGQSAGYAYEVRYLKNAPELTK